jgi:hypothetical protein
MKMKKLLILLMALMLALSFCACGGSSEDTAATDDSAAATEDTTSDSVLALGDTGSGPADLNAGIITLAAPEGFDYEVYSINLDDSDYMTGDLDIDFNKSDVGYGTPLSVVATTRDMVSSQDETVDKVIELWNLVDGDKTEIGDDVTYGDYTWTPIHITTEYNDVTDYVTYVARGGDDQTGIYVKVEVNNAEIEADDPAIAATLESIKVVMME